MTNTDTPISKRLANARAIRQGFKAVATSTSTDATKAMTLRLLERADSVTVRRFVDSTVVEARSPGRLTVTVVAPDAGPCTFHRPGARITAAEAAVIGGAR
jgi:hypothetical protein